MVSPAQPSGGRVKGAPLRAILDFWKTVMPVDSIERRLAAMPLDAQQALNLSIRAEGCGVLASSWYPAVACGAFLDAMMADVPVTELDTFVNDAAEFIMKQTLGGVHRAVFRVVGSPALMRDHAQTFWNRQFDTGRVRIQELGPGRQRHEYHDWQAHHPLICRITFACVAPMFVAMGVKSPAVSPERCVARGASEGFCSAIIHWTP